MIYLQDGEDLLRTLKATPLAYIYVSVDCLSDLSQIMSHDPILVVSKLFSYIVECIDYPGCREAFIAYEAERHLQGSTFCDRSDSKEMCPKLCSVCK